MRFGHNGWGGYAFGDWNVYHSYHETDKDGNEFGSCWCVKKDLDSKVCDFIADTLEECLEWILEED